jgi:tripartite-type tricarboxylate transporter receptor subunit TctC
MLAGCRVPAMTLACQFGDGGMPVSQVLVQALRRRAECRPRQQRLEASMGRHNGSHAARRPDRLRRRCLGALAGGGLLALAAPARAQAQLTRPLRLVVAFGPGSGNDLIARELGQQMAETLGQPVVVENRAGAGGALGTDVVAKAAPDGHTIGLGTSSQLVMNVALHRSLPFDVERDLRLIGLVSRTPMLLAASAAGPKSVADLIAQAKAQPGKLSYGSAGLGSISHIVAEAFAKAADIQLLHVPYKGNGPAMADLAGGHVALVFDGLYTTLPLAQQGKVQMLAISGSRRQPAAPQLPTFAEAGLPGYEATTWNCLFAPAKTAPELLATLNAALNKALASPAIQARLAGGGSEALGPSTPEQADAFARRERERWVGFIRGLNLPVG